MSRELTVAQPTELAHAVTPMSLIEQASARGASIEQMQQLFDLQLRWEANEAKKAFNAAFSAFKAEAIRIVKNVTVNDGPLKGKKHADLFGVVDAVTPAMARHGLSHSWKLTKDDPAWMEVTCTIKHVLGHSESFPMGGAPDTGPGRNAIQARGSANTYLERYTLLQAIGMAATDQDNDGRGSGQNEGMPVQEFDSWLANIENAANGDDLKKFFNAAYTEAQLVKDKGAMKQFSAARDARRKELGV